MSKTSNLKRLKQLRNWLDNEKNFGKSLKRNNPKSKRRKNQHYEKYSTYYINTI